MGAEATRGTGESRRTSSRSIEHARRPPASSFASWWTTDGRETTVVLACVVRDLEKEAVGELIEKARGVDAATVIVDLTSCKKAVPEAIDAIFMLNRTLDRRGVQLGVAGATGRLGSLVELVSAPGQLRSFPSVRRALAWSDQAALDRPEKLETSPVEL